MANPQDEWQSIIDFRAGISANLSPNHPPGTATTNTSGCYARDGAYLTPMPKINKTYYVDEPPASPEEPLNGQFNICGFRAVGPLYFEGPSEISSHKEVTNTELFFAVNWWSNPTTGIDRLNHQVMRYTRHYSNSPVWQTVWGPTRLPAYHDVPSWKGLWLRRNPGVATFAVQRSNPTDQLSYGPTVLTWAFNGMARMFPKDDSLAATNVDDTESVAGDGSDNSGRYPLGVYSHQGRIIVAQLDKPRWLGTKSFWVSTEAIYWTEQNNLSVLAAEFGGDYFKVAIAAGSEAYGYTAVIPVSASELILLRPRDGAVLMQGNLNDFNAITLPYLKGTGINFNAALSAKGLVYTSQGAGMWLWQGGDVSEYVSPGMDPNFWMVRRRLVCQGDDDTEIEWDNWMGQADSWGDWTMFSNNWVWVARSCRASGWAAAMSL
jgi:hypothetical protein